MYFTQLLTVIYGINTEIYMILPVIENNTNESGQGFSIDNQCMTPTFKLRSD